MVSSSSVSSGRGSPVVARLTATREVCDQRLATSAMASGRPASSSGSGRNACTDRQASVRLSLARARAWCR
jgi:hypothetical protein